MHGPTAMRRRTALASLPVVATLAVVLLPLPLVLPWLGERAVYSWHVMSFTDGLDHLAHDLVVILLAIYVAVLLLRYVAFVSLSAIDAASPPVDADDGADADLDDPRHADTGRAWPLVSIVVPAYNEGRVIEASVRSLLALDYPAYEVIVVDDGSSDDTFAQARRIAASSPRVRVLRQPNGGKASALNLGLAHARGSLVLNMDADSRLGADALRACARHFRNPAVGAVSGNIKVANRENVATRMQALEYIQGLALERRAQSCLRAVAVVGGPLGMFRRSALGAVGGYDADTFAEDRDLTIKLLAAGWDVLYEPAAKAWAESPSRWLDLLAQRYRWTRGTVQTVFKHGLVARTPRSRAATLSLWYMAADSFVVPLVTLATIGYFAWLAVAHGSIEYLLLWWSQAALFDVAVTCWCVALDREDPRLVPHALLMRVYAVFSDVAKLIATLEELLSVEMSWGKLDREGKL